MEELNSSFPQPPQYLSRLLEEARIKSKSCDELFEDFLYYSEQATKNAYDSNIEIIASYKLSSGIPLEMLPVSNPGDNQNNTLIQVFQFYAKIKHTYSATFSEADIAKETLNFSKVEIFCRDFGLIPKLLNRDDVRLIWEDIAQDFMHKGLGTFSVINFDMFQDFIVRLALWAYNKPGLKKLILSVEGFMPRSIDIIHYFCTYLHLDDDEYILNFLRTVGKKTQGHYNYRSSGETNIRTKLEVRIDTNARKVDQLKTKKDKPKPINPGNASSPAKTNVFGEEIENQIFTKGANPNQVINRHENIYLDFNEEKVLRRTAKLPDELLDRLTPQISEPNLEAIEPQDDKLNSSSPRSLVSKSSNHQNIGGGVDDFSDDEDYDYDRDSIASSSLASYHDNSFESLRSSYLQSYEPRLKKELAKYCYIPPKVVAIDWVNSKGPLMDLGLLDPGTKVSINISIINTTADEILIDTTARNIMSEDTNIKTFSKPLISGFTRNVFVTFTIPTIIGGVLGFIDIACVSARKRADSIISCPVFYRVDPSVKKDTFPRVTGLTLQDMLGQRRPNNERFLNLSFQKKKLNGTWSTSTRTLKLPIIDQSNTKISLLNSQKNIPHIKPS